MYLIIGLGNPDKKYLQTFHNVGFLCLDKLAETFDTQFDKVECHATTAHTRANGQKVILAKPLTYMNLSGQSVLELASKYKIESQNIAILYDDVDIPLGTVRIRPNGSAGTHNGMKSVLNMLQTEEIFRIRIGIGKETMMDLADFVLSKIPDTDLALLTPAIKTAASAAHDFASAHDPETIMRTHNKTTNTTNV